MGVFMFFKLYKRVPNRAKHHMIISVEVHSQIKPFHVTGLFVNSMKTSEYLWFPAVFRECGIRSVSEMG